MIVLSQRRLPTDYHSATPIAITYIAISLYYTRASCLFFQEEWGSDGVRLIPATQCDSFEPAQDTLRTAS